MTGLVRPPGVSARPDGPLLGSEWEDLLEADSVVSVKTLKATREHEMQNNAFVIHRAAKTAMVYFPGHILTIFPPSGSLKVTLSLLIMMAPASIFDIIDGTFSGHAWV